MEEFAFERSSVSEIIDEIKSKAEKCRRQPKGMGIRRYSFDFQLIDVNGKNIFDGQLFHNFKELVKVMKIIQKGSVIVRCNPHPI
jgi:hypothetical protein